MPRGATKKMATLASSKVPVAPTSSSPTAPEDHQAHCVVAQENYVASRTPNSEAEAWHEALKVSRKLIANALRASEFLTNIPGALAANGIHMLVFRHLLAPPLSQDQFALLCASWRKNTERFPGHPATASEAVAVAIEIATRRSKILTAWLDANRLPHRRELRRLMWAVAPLIASQQVATFQRRKAAEAQEGGVVALLKRKGWICLPSRLLDRRAELPYKHYMHKTRFATATTAPQEVDIALGMGGTVVLAMECKVTNDVTNSVKRINDVIKKAAAWRAHWGSFVRTAAMLQGVIAPKDVERLVDAGVEVFWSHDLASFETWIDAYTDSSISTV